MNATVTVFILLLACITAILVLRGGTPDADPGEEIEDLGIEIDEETKKILKELEEEEKKDQTLDCEGSWGDWSECTVKCINPEDENTKDGGTRERTYKIEREGGIFGNSCPHKDGEVETEVCNKKLCPVDCVQEWSEWSECTKRCIDPSKLDKSPGTQYRSFDTLVSAQGDGKACINPTPQYRTCGKDTCKFAKVSSTKRPHLSSSTQDRWDWLPSRRYYQGKSGWEAIMSLYSGDELDDDVEKDINRTFMSKYTKTDSGAPGNPRVLACVKRVNFEIRARRLQTNSLEPSDIFDECSKKCEDIDECGGFSIFPTKFDSASVKDLNSLTCHLYFNKWRQFGERENPNGSCTRPWSSGANEDCTVDYTDEALKNSLSDITTYKHTVGPILKENQDINVERNASTGKLQWVLNSGEKTVDIDGKSYRVFYDGLTDHNSGSGFNNLLRNVYIKMEDENGNIIPMTLTDPEYPRDGWSVKLPRSEKEIEILEKARKIYGFYVKPDVYEDGLPIDRETGHEGRNNVKWIGFGGTRGELGYDPDECTGDNLEYSIF